MRHPQNPTSERQRRLDRLEDLTLTLALVRRALVERAAGDVQARCRCFLRRLDDAPLPPDDRAEIAAAVEFIQDRVKYGLHQRLRRLLLPLVAAVESQMEMSE
jgi:hypothetical protein